MEKLRDSSIDILRFIGITGIIIAHISPSSFFMQLRNFDVPMMVFLSGLCFKYNDLNYADYLKKRFTRLVVPCWIFLILYFSSLFFYDGRFDLKNIIKCFTLTTNWFFWIIRVFLVMAILAPIFIKKINSIGYNNFKYVAVLYLILNEILCYFVHSSYIGNVIVMNIGYFFVYSFGMKITSIKEKDIKKISLLFFLLFVFIAIIFRVHTGKIIPTQSFKYPPSIYYLSYALSVILLLFLYRKKIEFFCKKIKISKILTFIGSHTIWIYLWHIPFAIHSLIIENILLRFIIVYFIACIMTYIQTYCVNSIILPAIINEKYKKTLKSVLIG